MSESAVNRKNKLPMDSINNVDKNENSSEFVLLYSAANEIEATIIKGKLESAGIETVLSPDISFFRGRYSGTVLPGAPWLLHVHKARAEEAKRLLGIT